MSSQTRKRKKNMKTKMKNTIIYFVYKFIWGNLAGYLNLDSSLITNCSISKKYNKKRDNPFAMFIHIDCKLRPN